MAITASQAQGLVLALFGASAGGHLTGLTGASSLSTLAGDLSTSAGLILGQDLSSNTAFRDLVLTTNLKLTGTALTEAQAWMDGEFTKGTSRADILTAAVTYLEGLTDTTSAFYAAAAAYRTTVADAVTWSQGAGANVLGVTALRSQQGHTEVVVGSSFTLTTASESFVGTAGNDTFTATNTTFLSGDVLADASTTDSDTLTLNFTALPASQGTAANIENVVYNVTSFADLTLDMTGITGAKSVTVNNLQTAGTSVLDINGVATGTTVNAGTGVTGAVTVTGAAAAAVIVNGNNGSSVTVDGVTTGSVVIHGGAKTTSATATTVTTGSATIDGDALTSATAAATTGSVTVSGAALAAATVTGATTNVTLTKAGTTTTPTTVSVTGNGAADVANVSAAGVVSLTRAANIETVNLSGNGAAVTYNEQNANTYTTLNLTGSQSVTVAGDEAAFDGKTVTDSTTAGTTTVKLTNTVASNSDLTKVAVDVIEQNGVLAGAVTYKLANAAVLDVTAAQTAVVTLSTAATTATTGVTTDSVTVNAKNAATVLITSDSSTAATETAFNTVNFSAATANTTLTALLGNTTGVLNLSGNKQITLDATTTADKVDATALTGALVATASATTTDNIIGGSGDDVITTATGAVVTLDGGTGSNTVKVVGDMSSVAFTNFAVVEATGAVTAAKASQLDGKSFVLKGTSATTFSFGNTAANYDKTSIDLSKLVTNNINSFTVDASNGLSTALFTSNTAITVTGSDLADTVTGTANADTLSGGKGTDTINGGAGNDTIDGGAGDDTLNGNAGADSITAGEGVDTVTGGAGNDTINLTETTAAADLVKMTLSTDGTDTITGFAAGTGADVLSFAAAGLVNGTPSSTLLTLADVAAFVAGGTAIGANDIFVEITASQTAGGVDTAAEVATLLSTSATAMTNIAATDKIAIALDDGTDTYVWYWQDSATNTGKVDAAELTLAAKLVGVTDIADGDLATF